MSTMTSRTQAVQQIESRSWIQRHPLVAYFVIAFLGAWALVIPLAMSTGFNMFTMPDPVLMLLFVISAYPGPFLAALMVTRALEGKEGVRRLWRRVFQFRAGLVWYLVALFIMMVIWLAAYSIPYRGTPILDLLANPLLLITVFLPWVGFGLFVPSLSEEIGWRGFALPRLQNQYGPLVGTLILGFLHGLWHIPALFTAFMGPLKLDQVLPFVIAAAAGTFLYTWVFNNTRGSIWMVILMHAANNATSRLLSEIMPLDTVLPAPFHVISPDWYNAITFILAAVILLIATRGRLGYRQHSESII
jgi:uncharacterized protein